MSFFKNWVKPSDGSYEIPSVVLDELSKLDIEENDMELYFTEPQKEAIDTVLDLAEDILKICELPNIDDVEVVDEHTEQNVTYLDAKTFKDEFLYMLRGLKDSYIKYSPMLEEID